MNNYFPMSLQDKIDRSIALIRKAEPLALSMSSNGFHVGFSGGKDIQVLLQLVKMAGVKYYAEYSVTGNDPADNVYFIRNNYPDVHLYHPKEKFIQLVARKGLPTRRGRYCCEILKEGRGAGCVVLTGVRAEESVKRSKYSTVAVYSTSKKRRGQKTIQQIVENEHRCIKGKDKIMIYPILEWTTDDVWQFIKKQGLPINPCYEKQGRVGCMLCPFAKRKEKERYLSENPRLKQAFINVIDTRLKKSKGSNLSKFSTPEEALDWWLGNDSVAVYLAKKRQLNFLTQNH